ncbi:cell envelope integrity EipB family protein [Rhizobium paknamense]|uniref:Fe-S cluster assembly iron-binding protein IscA n=1 Tax=Rhizobium paknamense TaxID=1206817 RepID=A0ABU0IG99_9HYPH|nr:cell envelope integrity EipB family protein [Rhizobium paknamense]MDQ0457275.1 Fe-S cluster assembly iron-binding protein IscA [Rhizobium paknamense]
MPQATLALLLALSGSVAATPVNLDPKAAAGELAPHRATYDITLKRASDQSGVEGMSGRMVYEFNGSSCSGYTTNFRFVTKIETGDDVSVTDQQVHTFEDPAAQRFDFESKSFTDDKLDKDVKGNANQKQGGIRVEIKQPQRREVELASARFPAQHMLDILAMARKGTRFLEARVFDGTEDGDKSYLTTTVVGAPERNGGERSDPLKGATYWPVSIAYFDDESDGGDQLPVYTQSFNLFDNGVTRDLTLDYGDVVLTGKLSRLEMLDKTTCQPPK